MEHNNENRQTAGPAHGYARLWERESVLFALIFFVLTLAACWPILLHPARHLGTMPIADKGTNLWNLWWVYYALFERGISPLRCDMIFIPWGCDLRFHTLSIVNGILASPVTGSFGPVVAFNLLFMAWTALTGIFAALWARQFGARRPVAILIGVIAAFGPYRWAHMTHLNLFSTPWLFLSFFLCERSVASRRRFDAVWITVAWLLAFFSDWYYGLFVGLYLAVRSGLLVLQERSRENLNWIALYAATPTIVMGAIVWAYFYNSQSLEGYVDPVSVTLSVYWSIDLMHFLLPLWLLPHFPQIQQSEEFWQHPGFVLLLLSLLFFRYVGGTNEWRWRKKNLLALTLVFFIISLGPVLMCDATAVRVIGVPIFLPAGLFEIVPGLTTIRVYARFAYVGILTFLLLGLLGMQNWIDTRGYRRGVFVACLMLSCVFVVETGWRFPLLGDYEPSKLIFPDSPKPVLELPFTPSLLGGLHLYHQTLHHQPIFAVEFSRLGHYKEKYLTSFPALTVLNRVASGKSPTEGEPFDAEQFCRDFKQLGSAHMVFAIDEENREETDRIRAAFHDLFKPCAQENIEYHFLK